MWQKAVVSSEGYFSVIPVIPTKVTDVKELNNAAPVIQYAERNWESTIDVKVVSIDQQVRGGQSGNLETQQKLIPHSVFLYMRLFIFITCLLASLFVQAQVSTRFLILNKQTHEPLWGATVQSAQKSGISDAAGRVTLLHAPAAQIRWEVGFSGFQPQTILVQYPDTSIHWILLEPEIKKMDEVIVASATRSELAIENAPLKVEVLGKEEMEEENAIRPANIASILGDVSGVQIQQSSMISGNANVRMQGLDGRYTQIVRDGVPLYDGFSGGFGILTIPPLDLKQIELIKGSASTIYGGGAIGGLINLVSRKPGYETESTITLNQTSLQETNLNAFWSKRGAHIGFTGFAAVSRQQAVDVNQDAFSDVPNSKTLIVHPRFFGYLNAQTTLIAGYSGTFDRRSGGVMQALSDANTGMNLYSETHRSQRHTAEFSIVHRIGLHKKLELKSSFSAFHRSIQTNEHRFDGRQQNYFAEATYQFSKPKMAWVSGINFVGDHFLQSPGSEGMLGERSNTTLGVFSQLTRPFSNKLTAELGIRYDWHPDYGSFFLPRMAFIQRIDSQWALRLGAGWGYKLPNALAVQNSEMPVWQILPLSGQVRAERSLGLNLELNYRKRLGDDVTVLINQAFFITRIDNPVIATHTGDYYGFTNAGKNVTSRGFDTYLQLTLDEWELYAGYTFTQCQRNYLSAATQQPLTPRNRWAFVLVRELGHHWRIGLEGSYIGAQFLEDHSVTPGYFFLAGMIERKLGKHFSCVLNGENLFNYRQSNTAPMWTGTLTHPEFKTIWAPVEGRVLNLSMRWSLAR